MPSSPASPRRRRMLRLVVVVAVLVVVGTGAGVFGGRAWLEHRPIRAGIAGCVDVRNAASRIECLRERALERAREQGPAEAAVQLRDVAGTRFPTECHLAMHALGERAGQGEVPSDFAKQWKRVDLNDKATCDQGWVHGYMAVAFVDVDKADLPAALESCTKVIDRPGECDHALGHVFVRAATGDGLIEGLEACTALGAEFDAVDRGRPAPARIHDCQHGAVMEEALQKAGDADPVADPCRAVDEKLPKRNCYEFLAARAVLLGTSWREAGAQCEALPAGLDRDACRTGWLTAAPDRGTCSEYPDPKLAARCREERG